VALICGKYVGPAALHDLHETLVPQHPYCLAGGLASYTVLTHQ
jgi:hypothetical protein